MSSDVTRFDIMPVDRYDTSPVRSYNDSMLSLRDSERMSSATYQPRYMSARLAKAPTEINWKKGELDAKYECRFCESYLKGAVILKNCSHRVCSLCLNDILRTNAPCPTCHAPVAKGKANLDNELNKQIQHLGVFCGNMMNGCEWEGILKEHVSHLEECEYGLVDCIRGCGQRYQKRNEKQHLAEDCLKNETICEFCDAKTTKLEEANHLNVCPKFPIPCPAGCGIREIRREEMKHHLENQCNKNAISCPFNDSGCTYKSLRSEMGKHLKESPGLHLNMMCKTIGLQKKQLKLMSEIIEAQKDKIVELCAKVDSMEHFNDAQLVWRIDKYAEKLSESKGGKKPYITSPTFYTSSHGYKLCLVLHLYGDGKAKGQYMSAYLIICRGEYDPLLTWPFTHKVKLTLLDQTADVDARKHISYLVRPNTCKENRAFVGRPLTDRNAPFGALKFVDLMALEDSDYTLDDCIYIKAEVALEEMARV